MFYYIFYDFHQREKYVTNWNSAYTASCSLHKTPIRSIILFPIFSWGNQVGEGGFLLVVKGRATRQSVNLDRVHPCRNQESVCQAMCCEQKRLDSLLWEGKAYYNNFLPIWAWSQRNTPRFRCYRRSACSTSHKGDSTVVLTAEKQQRPGPDQVPKWCILNLKCLPKAHVWSIMDRSLSHRSVHIHGLTHPDWLWCREVPS